MKKINFKQQKYVLPLFILPFLFLGFYLYKDTFEEEEVVVVGNDGLQDNIADVSDDVKQSELTTKLEAFQQRYKDADGYTAISGIGQDDEELARYDNLYSDREKARLDSMEEAFQRSLTQSAQQQGGGYVPRSQNMSASDKALLDLLNTNQERRQANVDTTGEQDPLEMMKLQYQLMDSLQKSSDPEYQEEQERLAKEALLAKERERRKLNKLTVQRATNLKGAFNTIKPSQDNSFIKAILDENITGYADSRIRIRLLEDIMVGDKLIKKGTYLYALINGFTGQRVTLAVTSIMHGNSILPINLNIYDMDGMEGLYVPQSAFREFTKELGSSSMQGMNMTQSPQNQNEFLMSGLQRAFTSTSQAIANAIRKNKANLKYNTYIYLIDNDELQK